MKFLKQFGREILGEIAGQMVGLAFVMAYAAGYIAIFIAYSWLCVAFFNTFRITDTTTQVFLFITPFLALAFWLHRGGKIK